MWYFMVYFVYGITKYTIKYHIQLLKYKIQRLDTGLDSQTRRFVESETLESKTGERCRVLKNQIQNLFVLAQL